MPRTGIHPFVVEATIIKTYKAAQKKAHLGRWEVSAQTNSVRSYFSSQKGKTTYRQKSPIGKLRTYAFRTNQQLHLSFSLRSSRLQQYAPHTPAYPCKIFELFLVRPMIADRPFHRTPGLHRNLKCIHNLTRHCSSVTHQQWLSRTPIPQYTIPQHTTPTTTATAQRTTHRVTGQATEQAARGAAPAPSPVTIQPNNPPKNPEPANHPNRCSDQNETTSVSPHKNCGPGTQGRPR